MTEVSLPPFATFGDLLKFLRRRARLTQRELSIAVGYSEAHISRLEQNQRLPDLATIAAVFVPALELENEPEVVARLLELAAMARGESLPQSITITHTESRKISEEIESIKVIPRDNLPLQLTSFIGRETQIAEVKRLLTARRDSSAGHRSPATRLVTLTGTGGSGKTRLAVQVAVEMLPAFPGGVWFVELAPLSDSALVAQTVANVLGVREAGAAALGQALLMALNHYLHDKTLLLVLDNCEHLVEGCARLTEALLRASPNLRILATSRETLNIAGEIVYQVPPLSTPDPDHLPSVEALMQYEAVRLFIERASTAWPGFGLTEANALAVAKICHHLDGIPLALELAAARVKVLNVEQIAARLADAFHLLAEGSRTALPRHQTLQATIDWSYNLLSDSERTLLRRLSVFAGGWTLEAAEKVTNDEVASEGDHNTDHPAFAPVEVLDLLSQLVNKSLVLVLHQPGSKVRYAMLETIRAYALEKMSAAGETAHVCARHFDFFYDLAQQAEPKLFVSPEVNEISRMETEIDNLRAALTWALEPDIPEALQEERAERGLELMTYVWPLWLYRGYSSQGSEWLDRLLAAHTAPTPARARALLLASDFARTRGDIAREGLLAHQALAMSRELGDKQRIAWSLMEVGLTERGQAHYSQAITSLTEAMTLFQELGDSLWVYRTSFMLAETHLMHGDLEAARRSAEAGLDWFRQQGDKWHIAWGLLQLGTVARMEGQLEHAAALYAESLKLRVEVLDKLGVAASLLAFAQLAALQQQATRAAVLWGAADQLRQTLGIRVFPPQTILYTSLIPKVRAQLGDEAFVAAWAKGRELSLAQAVEYAFADEPPAQGS